MIIQGEKISTPFTIFRRVPVDSLALLVNLDSCGLKISEWIKWLGGLERFLAVCFDTEGISFFEVKFNKKF